MSATFLIVSVALLLVHSSSAVSCKARSYERLCVTDDSIVVLENERLSMTIIKAKGQIASLYYNSNTNTSMRTTNVLSGGSVYYLANVDINGTSVTVGPTIGEMKITESDERIDLTFIHNDTNAWPIQFEFHIVLETNSSIFYYYSIHNYLRDGYAIEQLRWAVRASADIFKYYSVDGKRQGSMPKQSSINAAETVYDWTYLFTDGTVYSKYQQISANEDINTVFGIYGDDIGMSLIQTHKEWVNGGPFKQDLTTHTGQMLLFHEYSAHYGTEKFVPTSGWSKVHGPIGFYLNEGSSVSEMYADAQRQLEVEEQRWPYSFVTASEYNAAGRGSVSGVLTVNGSASSEWTYLILTDPSVDEPQFECGTYMYSANADTSGAFTIPAVRPGTYKLQVIAKGVVGKYVQSDIVVQQGNNTNLGSIDWIPESHGTLLWQIGVPDRSGGEFKIPSGLPSPIPNLEEFRKFGTWLNYSNVFPNDPDFTIGESDAANDWCYFMPMVKTPGFANQLQRFNITQNTNPTNWKVRFSYSGSTSSGNATLTMGLASAINAGLRVLINDNEIYNVTNFDGNPQGSALFRLTDHSIFRQITITFSKSLLQSSNVLQFTPPGEVSDSDMAKMVMWDYMRLEASSGGLRLKRTLGIIVIPCLFFSLALRHIVCSSI